MRRAASDGRAVYRIELAPADAEGLEVIAEEWSEERERAFSPADVAAELVRRAVKRRARRRARSSRP